MSKGVLFMFSARSFTVLNLGLKNIFEAFPEPQGFPGGSDGKEFASSAGDLGLIPESGRSPGE